jgi:hypothetical protein
VSRIDPLQIAQFFALPGAAELVEAFSAIPPGELRDSAVSHVQIIARHCGWTPDYPFGAEQTQSLASPSGAPKRLPSPFADDLKSASAEGQIIERALRGEASAAIAADIGSTVALVERLKGKARKEGGLVFPGDAVVAPAKSKPGSKSSKLKGRRLEGVPVPPSPYWWEDPASPIWDNPKLLPTLSAKAEGSMAGLGPLDHRSFVTMSNAAARHNMTLRQYIAQRFEILRRINAGETPTQVAIDLRVTPYAVWGLLAKIGQARGNGAIAAHYAAEAKARLSRDDEAPDPPPIEKPAAPVERRPNVNTPETLAKTALAAKRHAAKKWVFNIL